MVTHDVIQGSIPWLKLHLGIPTAGCFDRIMDTSFDYRKGVMPKSLIAQKAAEAWKGQPLLDLNTFSVEQGTIVEERARPFFELHTDRKVATVGFISTDDGTAGCSPDGIIDGNEGLEIKCPAAHTHVKYLLDGILPAEYSQQVYGGLWVTGFQKWTFMSYREDFPPLIVEVERDEEVMDKIGKAIAKFTTEMKRAMDRLTAMDKGEMGPWEVAK